jgi:hypothetical protein
MPNIISSQLGTFARAVIREEPDDEATRDGITARAKVPSWDEIMFGIKPEDSK